MLLGAIDEFNRRLGQNRKDLIALVMPPGAIEAFKTIIGRKKEIVTKNALLSSI